MTKLRLWVVVDIDREQVWGPFTSWTSGAKWMETHPRLKDLDPESTCTELVEPMEVTG